MGTFLSRLSAFGRRPQARLPLVSATGNGYDPLADSPRRLLCLHRLH